MKHDLSIKELKTKLAEVDYDTSYSDIGGDVSILDGHFTVDQLSLIILIMNKMKQEM